MRPTRAADRRLIPTTADRVFPHLLAVDRYADWWPGEIGVEVLTAPPHGVGSVVAIKLAQSGGGFRCRIVDADAPYRLVVEYVEGAHRGQGVWTLEPQGGDTLVTYSVDLRPRGLVVGLLSYAMDFGKLHSQLIGDVLEGLERVATKERAAEPETPPPAIETG